MKAADTVLDLIYPSRCVVCGGYMGPERPGICPACRAELPAPEKGPKRGEFVSKTVSVFSYEGAYREAVLRFKFGRREVYARPWGRLLAAKIRESLAGDYDLVTWLPIHRERRRERGYDQAKLLAVQAARALGDHAVRTLRKVRNNPRQSGLHSLAERKANVLNAYRAVRPARFRGKRVLLIDDILTSGATVSEAARTLLTAGAAEVVCATLALTPRKQSR